MILAIKTDSPICELSLIENDKIQTKKTWQAGRQLALQLPGAIEDLLKPQQLTWDGLNGIIAFQGPGSFTGLRIGITVANAIAYSQGIPAVGARGEDWIKEGSKRLKFTKDHQVIVPYYGSAPRITKPKK